MRLESRDGAGEQLRWTFREPCLTLRLTEPLLSLAFDGARADRRLVRVHVTGAAAPVDPGTGRLLAGGVALDVGTAGLRRAAAGWSADLDAVAP